MRILLLLSLLLSSSFSYSQLTPDTGSVIRPATVYVGVQNPNSGCGCNSSDPSNPCTGTSIVQNVSGNQFVWTLSCSGGNCQCGRFVNGDFWVKHPSGGDVVISAVTPAGNENGLVLDPSTSVNTPSYTVGSQGFLGNASGYSSSLNKMLNLPLSVSPNKTLVKTAQTTAVSGYPSVCGGYIAKSYSMLTVLGSVPSDGANGRNSFRPAYVAGAKTIHTISNFNFTRLAGRTDISVTQSDLDAISSRWWKPYPDNSGGDFGRCFVPSGYYPDNYAAGIATATIQDILKLNGNLTGLSSDSAKYSMIQRGLDLYYSWRYGNKWECGAGQCLGRKEPIIYMAALSTDATIRSNVSSSAAVATDFQEDTQLRVSNSGGAIIWGAPSTAGVYWTQLFGSKCYDGASPLSNCKETGSGDRSAGDPYGYISGPAQAPGSIYMATGSSGTHIGHATIMLAWQHYCEMANDQKPITYSSMLYYPSETTASGQVLNLDPCAPPDPGESSSCQPYKAGAPGCLYYGGRTGATDANSTWGPLPSNPSQCVSNNSGGNTGQTGRFSWLHGQRLIGISLSGGTPGAITFNATDSYMSSIVKNQYATIRTATPKCSNGVWTP